MKFPRNTRIYRGQLEVAPFIGVFFLLIIFLVFNSGLVVTPGVPIRLPPMQNVPGTFNPTLIVAVDASGQLYYENQVIMEEALRMRLQDEADRAREPFTLVIHADMNVRYEVLLRLGMLAQSVGIKDAMLATRPVGPALGEPVLQPE